MKRAKKVCHSIVNQWERASSDLLSEKKMNRNTKTIDDFAKNKGKLVPISPQNAQWNVITSYNEKHQDAPIEHSVERWEPISLYS